MFSVRQAKVFGVGAVAIVLLAAAMLVAFQPRASAAQGGSSSSQSSTTVRVDLVVVGTSPDEFAQLLRGIDPTSGFTVDSFFDITYLSNIGSSGQDGVEVDFAPDSFFDITYRITGDPDFDLLRVTVQGTLSSASGAPVDGSTALTAVGAALDKGGKKEYVGHVTLMK